jgi:hypothetical protein
MLLQRESVDRRSLEDMAHEQPQSGQRIVSLLIDHALIDTDEGALALSEQSGFPAALERHLERRDVGAIELVPRQLARAWVVVPIGLSQEGEIVICARDPTRILAAALAHATGSRIKLAVAPAIHVERLVRSIYDVGGDPDMPLVAVPPSLADIGESVVSGEMRSSEPRRSHTISALYQASANAPSGPIRVPLHDVNALELTLQEIDKAFNLVSIERLVMTYAAERWHAALLVKIVDGVAVGHSGHGETLAPMVDAIALPLSAPSLISVAVETRGTASESPSSGLQTHLMSLLGDPQHALATPIECRGRVHAVLVVGDVFEGHYRDSVKELDRIADALGAAYDRFSRKTRDL